MSAVEETDALQERKEIIQDVIDRLLSNPEYKQKLLQLNKENPPLVDYNRRLKTYQDENNSLSDNFTGKAIA